MTTIEPKQVTHFKMGEDIPEWLLMLIPATPQATRGFFRFATDVDVIDTPDYYVICATGLGYSPVPIDDTGTADCAVYAAGKPVKFVTGFGVIFPVETDMAAMRATIRNPPPVQLAPPIGFDVLPPQPAPGTPGHPLYVHPRKQNLLYRLLAAFRG